MSAPQEDVTEKEPALINGFTLSLVSETPMLPILPIEIINQILLSHPPDDPIIAFRIGVLLSVRHGYSELRDYAIPLLATMDRATLDSASEKAQIDLLDWWLRWARKGGRGRELKYTAKAMDSASCRGHLSVLDWWSNSGLTLLFTKEAVQGPIAAGREDVLTWWKQRRLFMAPELAEVEVLALASEHGHVHILEWWKTSGMELEHFLSRGWMASEGYKAWENASAQGHVEVLEWWKHSGLPFGSVRSAIVAASTKGHVAVLEWYSTNGYDLCEICYGKTPLDGASRNGHMAVLEWWEHFFRTSPYISAKPNDKDQKRKDFERLYSDASMDLASEYGHIQILDWWKRSGYAVKFTHMAVAYASRNGDVGILDWWAQSALIMDWTTPGASSLSLEWACERGHVHVLEWWKQSGYTLEYGSEPLYQASKNGHISILEWWARNGLILHDDPAGNAMDAASQNGHVAVLEWWKQHKGKHCTYTRDAIDSASAAGHIAVLEWWKKSGLSLRYSDHAIQGAANVAVLEWWKESGLEMGFTQVRSWRHRCTPEIVRWWGENEEELSRRMEVALAQPSVAVAERKKGWKERFRTGLRFGR
ncbi:hypothetical protein HDV00_001311 [Rhizophlyctis rosea]|nr:hypothetical protein HDV00_001311 [Rhizophlyctis rosea]